uniref:Peptidase A1 domain-containing protein n=1 Tax=Ananas comosus var. bracteatus TaxID=296719 RepID=A0A6V7PR97_ANACO|nr:unnamed protein product [Ananas comosus var. bracteatus]
MMHHKMAQIIHTPTYSHIAILIFTALTLLIAPSLSTTLQNGFILELIHRFSIHSPSYSPNVTFVEKIERLVEISDNRVEWIESSLRADGMESGSLMGIRPTVTHDRGVYMAKVGIGKPPTNVHLLLDSRSSLVWTQCAPCVHCFPQDPPVYNPAFSDTYRPLPCTHPFCARLPCINNMCRFVLRYEDNTYTKGIMAAEQFTFASNVGATESVGAAFGCSSESSPNMFPSTRAVSGILGVGAGPASFLSQLGSLARGRFSYCLVPIDLPSAGVSYLRFGADTERIKNGRTTPMLRSFDRTHYFVELQDISVDGRRLHLPPGTFARRPDGTGGCLLDSGTSATYLTEIAYTAVCNTVDAFFAGRNFTRVRGTIIMQI